MSSNYPRLTLRDLFDADYYRRLNPDLARFSNNEAFSHFQNYGVYELRKFSPFFDTSFYLVNNPDVRAVFAPLFNPTLPVNISLQGSNLNEVVKHFINNGVYEGRRFTPLPVDLNYYRNNNPDLAQFDNSQLLNHLIDFGLNEGRRFTPLVDLNFYRASNPDLARLNNLQLLEQFANFGQTEVRTAVPEVGQTLSLFDVSFYRAANPTLQTELANPSDTALRDHFLNFGLREGRRFSPFFDVAYYLNANPDLRVAGLNNQQAYEHFLRFGLDEGRRFSQFVDVNYYLANNPDLRAAGFTRRQAFNHLIQFGLSEGRRPSILFDPAYYIANNPDLLARQVSFRQAFQEFQVGEPPNQRLSGFQLARPASILDDPRAIAPLLSPPQGVTATSLPDWLQRAARWGDIPVGGTLTYSFVTTASALLYNGQPDETNIAEVNPAIKNSIRNIMRQYNEVLGINLVEVPDRPPNVGRIRIMFSGGPDTRGTSGYANQPSDSPGDARAGDIHLDPTLSNFFSDVPGSLGYQALLNVVGFSLGLDDYTARRGQSGQGTSGFSPDLNAALDNNTNTVLTKTVYSDPSTDPPRPPIYNGVYARTPMSYDIRALQYLYGASYLNATDSVYAFNANNFINVKQTIWDAGGIDTLDFSRLPAVPFEPFPPETVPAPPPPPPPPKTGYYFDMNEGGQLTAQNALNRASYQLLPIGNQAGGGTEPPPRPILFTSLYNTSIAFGAEIENLVASPGNDEILGNNLSNNIAGGAGDDIISGARGADIVTGGSGQDVFVYARGDGGSIPTLADTIIDYRQGEDKIGLAIGLRLDQVRLDPGATRNDTLLRLADTGEYLALLRGVPFGTLGPGDFVFV